MIRQQLQTDQIAAMKARDGRKLETIRYILAQIKNKEVDTKIELIDDEVVVILRKIAKELHESIAAFEKGNRADLSADSKEQLAIVATYLPVEMPDDQLREEVLQIIEKNKEMFTKSPKSLIGICIKELKSKVDPARITKMVLAVSPS